MIVKKRENREQVKLFSIEEFVPAEHLLRQIDSAVKFAAMNLKSMHAQVESNSPLWLFKVGSSLPYYHCLEYLIAKKKEQTYPVTLHTDHGSVYSTEGFYQTHKDYTNIKRSMSRVGTPTDNPIIESLNRWIKEMRIDFNLITAECIPSFIENYVHYFNNEKLSYKLNYKTPV